MTAGCDLCDAAAVTTRYYEDEDCWIADCEICLVPMVVWRVHDAAPDDATRAGLHQRLAAVADAELGADGWKIDEHMRNIPDHYHAHARPPFFWRRG
ncbi:MAG: hypothetical protein ACHQFZ_02995 [Acidimicrobiales bacterium]